jgi:hypothetical protein
MSAPMGSAWLQRWVAAAIACLLSCLLLAGCAPSGGASSASSRSAGSAGSAGQDAGAADKAQADQSADPLAGMVAAVDPAGTSSTLSVKFRIEARPVIGMPVKIMVAVIPAANVDVDHIHGSFLPGSGLLLQSDRGFDIAPVQGGSPVFREVTVVPQQTGVLSLSATLLLNTDKSSQTRTYSIPLIAADNSGP